MFWLWAALLPLAGCAGAVFPSDDTAAPPPRKKDAYIITLEPNCVSSDSSLKSQAQAWMDQNSPGADVTDAFSFIRSFSASDVYNPGDLRETPCVKSIESDRIWTVSYIFHQEHHQNQSRPHLRGLQVSCRHVTWRERLSCSAWRSFRCACMLRKTGDAPHHPPNFRSQSLVLFVSRCRDGARVLLEVLGSSAARSRV
jgi:hypothetical protein